MPHSWPNIPVELMAHTQALLLFLVLVVVGRSSPGVLETFFGNAIF
jgi:hypothetical protein